MRSDNLSTISSQPSSACTIKTSTSASSSTTSGWSLAASSRQWPLGSSANNNNNNNNNSVPSDQKAQINTNKSTTTTTTTAIPDRQYSCAGNKFHRAAIDGYVDMLCEASKRDTNTHAPDDFLQLTPTLLAAQSGQLEALRILVGRGGDPERVSALGSSALHLAAARNHLNCVSFLVNFGANMWALDNELRTAKDIAALGQCQRVLEYLDQMMAKQSAINTKLVQKLKDKAKVGAEKRLKQMRKQQLKAIKQVERDERLLAKLSNNRRLLKSAHSMSDIKLVGRCGDPAAHNPNGRERLAAISFSPNDPLARRADQQQKTFHKTKVINFLSNRFQCPPVSAGEDKPATRQQHSDLDSSYCSSSVSSASGGYLSSCSARSILKSTLALRKPPAAIGDLAPALVEQSTRAKSPGHHNQRPRYSDLVALDQSQQQSTTAAATNSESLLTSRLRGLGGGVSRKVHLKRLLFASTAADAGKREHSFPNESPQMLTTQHKTCELAGNTPAKLCQVSPTSRLKMSGERAHRPPDTRASYGQLKRTISEPDFGSAMRNQEDSDDEEDLDDNQRATSEHELDDDRPDIPTPPPEPPGPASPAAIDRHEPQQHLLTRCLSQLKLKQQQQQQHESSKQSPPVGHSGCIQRPPTGSQLNSDELIRHQLSASEFPLRPSVIKQQLHMRHQQQQLGQEEKRRKSTTIMSVDSIGSASSFVQRNTDLLVGHGDDQQLQPVDRNASSSSSSSSALSSVSFDGSGSSASSSTSEKFVENNNNNNNNEKQVDHMVQFLASNNLSDLASVLAEERIDLEALLLLSEADLKSLNILLGPRRKLLNAIGQYKSKQRQRQQQQSKMGPAGGFTVVDTQF